MLTAVVTHGTRTEVRLVSSSSVDVVSADEGDEHGEIECEFPLEEGEVSEYPCAEGPSPVMPELKEFLWGGGSFIVMAVVLSVFLVPKVMKGMQARYDHIEGSKAEADSMRAAAKADVAQYDSSLETVKAEARERVEAARQQLEAERAAKLEEVNAAIAAKRDAANAETTAARHAVEDQVSAAVNDVTSRTLELAIGKAPDAAKVSAAVSETMSGVSA